MSDAPSSAPYAISIHALLAESDHAPNRHPYLHSNFYPRSPCGERLVRVCELVWGVSISIHALLAESDDFKLEGNIRRAKFLSTLSLRRATAWLDYSDELLQISIHALLAESDALLRFQSFGFVISIHALLAESDTDDLGDRLANYCISIHALLAESDWR